MLLSVSVCFVHRLSYIGVHLSHVSQDDGENRYLFIYSSHGRPLKKMLYVYQAFILPIKLLIGPNNVMFSIL